jgi:hypothetical protein
MAEEKNALLERFVDAARALMSAGEIQLSPC